MQQNRLAECIDTVLRQLPADANTHQIYNEVKFLRGFVDRVRDQKTKPQTEGASDACFESSAR